MEHFLAELSATDFLRGWIKHSEKANGKVYYRQEPGLKGLTVYLEGVVNAPIMNLLAVISEIELFKEWLPVIKQSQMLHSVSHFRKLAYFRYKLPWPLKSREIFL